MLKFLDGTAIGRMDDEFGGRPVSDSKQLRVLELRYGTVRAEAPTTEESLVYIRQLLGWT